MKHEYIKYNSKKEDKRYKLTEKDQGKIIELYNKKKHLIDEKKITFTELCREIGEKYEIHEVTIKKIVDPRIVKQRKKALRKYYDKKKKENDGKVYTNKNKLYMQRYRLKKKMLNYTTTQADQYKTTVQEMKEEYELLGEKLKKMRNDA